MPQVGGRGEPHSDEAVDRADGCQDERVAYMAAVAVLDRAGVKPREFDPREEEKALSRVPMEERKARLRELMGQADQLLTRPSIHAAVRGKSSCDT
jgi:hypothetical protein